MCESNDGCCRHPGRGLIQLQILRMVYEKPTHGYQIMDHLRKFAVDERAPEPGAVYTMLRRLERRGLLSSRWEKETSRADRRIYTITKEGEAFLEEGLRTVRKRKELMDDLVRFEKGNFHNRTSKKRRGP